MRPNIDVNIFEQFTIVGCIIPSFEDQESDILIYKEMSTKMIT